jgi:hypothetical protein
MSKRLAILTNSLAKKAALFNEKLAAHFVDVKSANGQSLNDKRNGAATMRRWDRQNDSLRSLQESIDKTKAAIEREEGKIADCEHMNSQLPSPLLEAIESGTLNQWRKYPNTFFVEGVEKARIVWDVKKQVLCHRYTKRITDKDQWRVFAKTYNSLSAQIKELTL